jgi:hypothetical protein
MRVQNDASKGLALLIVNDNRTDDVISRHSRPPIRRLFVPLQELSCTRKLAMREAAVNQI